MASLTGALTGLSSLFLASASTITAGGMMINMKYNYGDIERDGKITCQLSGVGTDANCSLGGPYGDGLLALNIVAVVLNGILFFLMMIKWLQTTRKESISKWVRTTFTLITLAVMFAIATAGYNIYIQHNFGNQQANNNFSSTCDVTSGCESLNGSTGRNILGLNVAAIALSGMALLFHTGVVGRQIKLTNTEKQRKSR